VIEIKEIKNNKIAAAGDFDVAISEADRLFIMSENGNIGIGILSKSENEVIIRHIKVTDKPFQSYDLMTRTLLNAVRDMDITVKIDFFDPYFERFGFKKIGDKMTIKAKDINFKGDCHA
jgi:hypothetical protein